MRVCKLCKLKTDKAACPNCKRRTDARTGTGDADYSGFTSWSIPDGGGSTSYDSGSSDTSSGSSDCGSSGGDCGGGGD